MVHININVKKKDLFLIMAIVVFIAGAGVIIAYNPGGAGNPAVVGHSMNEIEFPACANGDNLMKVNGVWSCNMSNIIEPGTGYNGQTGTQACLSLGKKCVAVISHNFIADPVGCTTTPLQLHNCLYACAVRYNQALQSQGNPGVPDTGAGKANNIHSCNAQVGEFFTYVETGVVRCNGLFSAICD